MRSSASEDRSPKWTRPYAARLWFSDALVIALTVVSSMWVLRLRGTWTVRMGDTEVGYGWAMLLLGVLWLIVLNIVDSRSSHIVGHGVLEYQRVVNGTAGAFVLFMALAFFLEADLARSLFLVAAPVGIVLLLLSRWLWRQWLRARQRRGRDLHRAIVVGERTKVAHVMAVMQRTPGTGYELVGAITSHGGSQGPICGVPVLGDYEDAVAVMDVTGADAFIVASADHLDPGTLRKLSWAMADRDIEWIIAPAMTDVAGPRIHARPVAGLPLVSVAFPKLEGWRGFSKRAMDLVASTVLIVLFSPVLAAVALAVKLSSKGPIFYRQERIGRRGVTFGMLKFRSMVQNADDQLATLLDLQGTSDKPLFKVVDDPRITPVGRFIRKYSLDELPQLFNVVLGDMSLVGPRPQRAAEVALYDEMAHRRLLVKPGMSGLWQVSGRSALSWEDALRLDLYYIENWSFAQDIIILLRTFKAVVAPEGTAH